MKNILVKKDKLIKIIRFIGYLFFELIEKFPEKVGLTTGVIVVGAMLLGYPIISLAILIPITIAGVIALVFCVVEGINLLYNSIKSKYSNFES